jgi:Pycsar effector protein
MAELHDASDSSRVRALADDEESRDRLEAYVLHLLFENREEVKNADTKTSIMFGLVAAAIAFLASALLQDDSAIRTASDAVVVIAVIALCTFMVALVLLALSVAPRLGQPAPGKARYFQEIAQFPDATAMLEVVAEDATDPVVRHAQQLYTLSRIARRKYQYLRNSMYAVAAAMIILGLAALVGLFD